VKLTYSDKLNPSIAQFNDYICAEILAEKLELVPDLSGGTEIDVNDIPLRVIVEKKG
jgi:isoleucyl-tRNA synthetase